MRELGVEKSAFDEGDAEQYHMKSQFKWQEVPGYQSALMFQLQ